MIRRPALILTIFTGINLLNFIDRMIVAAVVPKIEETLHLSHFVSGLLSTIFLVGLLLSNPIFGFLGDRHHRVRLMAVGIGLWSAATFASGLAHGPVALLATRLLVGVGEASYNILAPAILDDIAPPHRRGRWLGIFYAAAPLGSALGFVLGGAVEHALGWRAVFFVAGGPGLVLAAFCLLIADPPREATTHTDLSVRDSFRSLWRVTVFRRAIIGYVAYTFAIGGFSFWVPSFLYQQYALPLNRANFQFGIVTVISGALASLGGGWIGDRLVRNPTDASDPTVARLHLRLCAWAAGLATLFAAIGFCADRATVFFLIIFACELAAFGILAPINVVLLRSAPPGLRARGLALAGLSIHLFGDLWSPPVIGAIADVVPLARAMQILPIALGITTLAWWFGSFKGAENLNRAAD